MAPIFLDTNAIVAGIAGAAATALVDWKNPWRALRKLIIGGLCATFLWPIAVGIIQPLIHLIPEPFIPDPDYVISFSAFITGVTGMIIVEGILTYAQKRTQFWIEKGQNK